MFKRIIVTILVIVFLPLIVVFMDSALGPRSPLGGNLELKLSHLIMGGPQSVAIDTADALTLFDDTCMAATVFKLPPFSVDAAFLAAGLQLEEDGQFAPPKGPMSAYSLHRPDGGFECFVAFISFEDIESVIKSAFEKFTQTRMNAPMTDDPDAFQFEVSYPPLPEGVQSDQPTEPDPATIRSFTDDTYHYYVILRPDSYGLRHLVQLIILPATVLDGDASRP